MGLGNSHIAATLRLLADLLEIRGENAFKVRAYRKAADRVLALPYQAEEAWRSGERLSMIPGIGAAIEGKLDSLFRTGSFPLLDRLREEVPESLLELLRIRGLGPARVRELREALGVADLEGLRGAVEAGKLRSVKGFTERTESRVRRSLYEYLQYRGRTLRVVAELPGALLVEHLAACPAVAAVHPAGSFRRGAASVGNLDVVVSTAEPAEVAGHLRAWPEAAAVQVSGDGSELWVRLPGELGAKVHLSAPLHVGALLSRFTGSAAHVRRLEERAASRGLRFGPEGLSGSGGPLETLNEADFYGMLGLPWIPPELREDTGEIEAGEGGGLPRLVDVGDIMGDLHMHTTFTDGRASVREMAVAGRSMGHRYVAITDHTRNVAVANGLHPEQFEPYLAEIRRTGEAMEGIDVLAGLEVDILPDGTLDMPDQVLERLDLVMASIHSHFDQGVEEMTARVLAGLRHPLVHVLAHPTGRLIGQRSPLMLDMDRVLEAAAASGKMLELNANPERLDLDEVHCRKARELGIPVVISTDAHSVEQLGNLPRGVLQARRGWLEARHVANTARLEDLKRLLRRQDGSE